MLSAIGRGSVEELFEAIPKELRLNRPLGLPPAGSEFEVRRTMRGLAAKNTIYPTIFRGAGAYRHYIPSVVDSVASRGEFVTAYTPYQAEISQGVLQAIFEYQTMITMLTGMDASNASVYDGATAAAEAAIMCQERRRHGLLLAGSTPPEVERTIRTYCAPQGIPVEVLPMREDFTLDPAVLAEHLTPETAAVYLHQPGYYGNIEDLKAVAEQVHQAGARLIVGCNPIALALLMTPGEAGADIAVGEGQPLGLPLSFGGPYLGFMACKQELVRRLPGRIVGETTDHEGRRAYVLTLQAREQHIRREKASSNICSNQALCALRVGVYLAAMGPEGLRQVAQQCYDKAHYAARAISSVEGFALCGGDFFHEFVTSCPCDPKRLEQHLSGHGILGGLPLPDGRILWCVTECNTREEIDRLVSLIKEVK